MILHHRTGELVSLSSKGTRPVSLFVMLESLPGPSPDKPAALIELQLVQHKKCH